MCKVRNRNEVISTKIGSQWGLLISEFPPEKK